MKLFSPEEVAEMAKLHRSSVYAAIHAGELEASKLRGRWRITEGSFEEWLEAFRHRPVVPVVERVLVARPGAGRLSFSERARGAA